MALLCGMTSDDFWHSEPRLISSYIKKREMELDSMNYQSWLNGLYVYFAIGTVISNAFSSKGSISNTYPEKPIEELFSYYKAIPKKDNHQQNKNFWAKLGKKEV